MASAGSPMAAELAAAALTWSFVVPKETASRLKTCSFVNPTGTVTLRSVLSPPSRREDIAAEADIRFFSL